MNDTVKPKYRTWHSCDCFAHALEVEVWEDPPHLQVDINFWSIGATGSSWRNLWQRLRDAWGVLRHGNVYVDTVTLKPDAARELAAAILEASEGKEPS